MNTATTDLVGGCHESVGHNRRNLSVEGRTATPGCGGHRLQHTCARRGRGTGRGVVQSGKWVHTGRVVCGELTGVRLVGECMTTDKVG